MNLLTQFSIPKPTIADITRANNNSEKVKKIGIKAIINLGFT